MESWIYHKVVTQLQQTDTKGIFKDYNESLKVDTNAVRYLQWFYCGWLFVQTFYVFPRKYKIHLLLIFLKKEEEAENKAM